MGANYCAIFLSRDSLCAVILKAPKPLSFHGIGHNRGCSRGIQLSVYFLNCSVDFPMVRIFGTVIALLYNSNIYTIIKKWRDSV